MSVSSANYVHLDGEKILPLTSNTRAASWQERSFVSWSFVERETGNL